MSYDPQTGEVEPEAPRNRRMGPITEELVQMAFDWLSESSAHVAAKRVAVMAASRGVNRAEEACKRTFAKLCRAEVGAVESRKWTALGHPEYVAQQAKLDEAEQKVEHATKDWEAVMDQREKCKMIIEAWRTASSNERHMGNFR